MEDKRKRYKFTCPCCGKIQYACKSIAQEMGLSEAGHGSCLDCKRFLRLKFNEGKQEMEAEEFK